MRFITSKLDFRHQEEVYSKTGPSDYLHDSLHDLERFSFSCISLTTVIRDNFTFSYSGVLINNSVITRTNFKEIWSSFAHTSFLNMSVAFWRFAVVQ